MGYIYIIKNKVNNKVYVGQTVNTIHTRWLHHISKANHSAPYPLYRAMTKHGVENFWVEELEVVEDNSLLDEREKFWVDHYQSYLKGYNATYGGGGVGERFSSDQQDEIVEVYLSLGSSIKTSHYLGYITQKAVLDIVKRHGFEPVGVRGAQGIPIRIVELDKEFSSIKDCAEFLIANNYAGTTVVVNVQRAISQVLRGRRKSLYKLHIEYID